MAEVSAAGTLYRAVLRIDPAEDAGIGLPGALRAMTTGAVTALWQGPDEFLLLSSAPIVLAIGAVHSLVDVSDRQLGFVVEGEDAELLLASGCPLDLDSLKVGGTTRTLFGKTDLTLWRVSEQRWHIEVGRSFAPYLLAMLAEAARSEGMAANFVD